MFLGRNPLYRHVANAILWTMVRRSLFTGLKHGSVVAVFLLVLFSRQVETFPGVGAVVRETAAVFRDSGTQWMVYLCLLIYFFCFDLVQRRNQPDRSRSPTLWLAGALVIGAVAYGIWYSPSIEALVLVAGVVIGQGAGLLEVGGKKGKGSAGVSSKAAEGGERKAISRSAGLHPAVSRICNPQEQFLDTAAGPRTAESNSAIQQIQNLRDRVYDALHPWPVFIVIVLLLVASIWNGDSLIHFTYRSRERWSGPWENPNLFGLLMGAGLALALGGALFAGRPKMEDGRWRKIFCAFLCVFAAILMGRGLFHSFSRGAWLATAAGLGYLAVKVFGFQFSVFSCWLRKNWVPLCVVLWSVVIFGFWQFRHTDSTPARRAFSSVNANDFSWRNRVAAWEGALQIMAEHPWLGAGWNQPERLYQNYYLPPRLMESAAIQMNDYLMLGASIGIPALGCFLMNIFLCLRLGSIRVARARRLSIETAYRAGALVLAVGFWFDSGLFKLATASMFWILLELGWQDLNRGGAEWGTRDWQWLITQIWREVTIAKGHLAAIRMKNLRHISDSELSLAPLQLWALR